MTQGGVPQQRAEANARAAPGRAREHDPFDDDIDDAEDAQAQSSREPLSPDDLPFNPYKGNRGLTRAWHAMKNSLYGFQVAIREESAFRQELTLAAILLPCSLFVPAAPVERAALIASVLLVLIVELLNSAIEAAVDRVSFENHRLAKRAKDIGSAAVMLSLANAAVVWGLILFS